MKPNTSNNDEHKTREEELQEGCKKEFRINRWGLNPLVCGKKRYLCPECRAELKGIAEGYSKALKNEIGFLENTYEKLLVPAKEKKT